MQLEKHTLHPCPPHHETPRQHKAPPAQGVDYHHPLHPTLSYHPRPVDCPRLCPHPHRCDGPRSLLADYSYPRTYLPHSIHPSRQRPAVHPPLPLQFLAYPLRAQILCPYGLLSRRFACHRCPLHPTLVPHRNSHLWCRQHLQHLCHHTHR